MSSKIAKNEQKLNRYGRSRAQYGMIICFVLLLASVHLTFAQSNALDFDGTDDNVQLPVAHYFTHNKFTVEAWVYPKSFNFWSRVFDFSNGPASDNVLLAISEETNGHPAGSVFNNSGGTNFRANSTIPLDTWTHLAIVVDGTTSKIYINGVEDASFTDINQVNDVERVVNYLGRSAWGGDGYANMILDEFKIWSVVLSPSSLADNLHNRPPANQPGLLVYFDFDQGTPGGDNTSITTLIDKSGNNYHGTFDNFQLNGSGSNFVAGVDITGEGIYQISTDITTETTITKRITDEAFELTATSTSPAPFVYTLQSGNSITLDGATVSIAGGGISVVRISQEGSGTFGPAFVDVTINVTTVPADLSGTLASPTNGLSPYSIAHGDVNNDGFQDLIVGYLNSSNVIVYTNDGTGAFGNPVSYAVAYPTSIATGDLNGDGNVDVAVSNYLDDNVSVLLNTGTGGFDMQEPYPVGSRPTGIVIGDLNNDGLLDIATSNYSSSDVSVLINLGEGSFDEHVTSGTGQYPYGIAIGDVNGDGKLDLAATSVGTNMVSVLINQGTGVFDSPISYSVGSNPFRIAIGDLDGDNKLDLVCANRNAASISVLINSGTGTFGSQVQYGVGPRPSGMALADLNDDGSLDVAVTNYSDGSVSVLTNTGSGTFNTQVPHAVRSGPMGITVGDWNNDSHLDLANANYNDNSLSITLNAGSGTFENAVNINTGYNFNFVAAGDLNNDGRKDLVATTNSKFLVVQMNLGNNSYSNPVSYQVGRRPLGVAIDDFNGDGNSDLATANSQDGTISILMNSGTGTFQPQVTYESGYTPFSIAAGDVDGDGDVDLVVADVDDNGVLVFINSGTGNFETPITYPTGTAPVSLALGDLDGDDDLDVVTVDNGDNTISILNNTGNGTFDAPVHYDVGDNPVTVAISDLNGDRLLDIIVVNYDDSNISVFTNAGDGTFDSRVNYSAPYSPKSLAIADLNGDNKPDVAITSDEYGTVSVLNNTGEGFEEGVGYNIEGAVADAVWVTIADLNNDGRLDIAGAGWSQIFTYLNTTEFPQTITFASLADKTYGDAAFDISATASSGLDVTFSSSNTAVATVSGNKITIVGAGSTTITASQQGAGFIGAAESVEQSLSVAKANQTITFAPMESKPYSDEAFDLSATTSSGLAITYTSSNTAVATVSGSTVTLVGIGSTSIIASQAGNLNYNTASSVERNLTVTKGSQAIAFALLTNKTFGDASFALAATGGKSGNPVTYTSSNMAVATVSGSIVTIVGAGSTSIIASQSGSELYSAATPVEQNLTVNKAGQTITFAPLATKTIGDAPFNLTGTASSSLAVTYIANDKVTITGNQVTLVKAGRATVNARQEGNSNYTAATPVEQSFCVNPAKPLIAENFADPVAPVLTSSASSGNQWYKNNELISGATGNTYAITAPGDYSVVVTVEGCVSERSDAAAALITGLPQDPSFTASVYPNPAARRIEIHFSEEGEKQLEIISMQGNSIHHEPVTGFNTSVDVVDYPSGVYILKVTTRKKNYSTRFIKN